MRKLVRFLVIGVFLAATGGVALAQGTTSELTGTVTSEGKPLPGVTVTVTSPALQGTRTKVTGPNGGYTFLALPPGDYVVTFELEGLAPVKQDVRLALAQTARSDAQMGVTGVKEAVTVTGESAMASVLESTQVATNFTGKEIGKLPVARTIRDTVLLAPGVSATGVNNQITISGAPSYDNLFLVDGVVVSENLRGQPHNLFIEDAIQETTILAGAVSAEYGRFTGGVVSTLTKSGGNEFHGSFRDTLSNPAWTDKTPWPTEADHVDNVDDIYEGTLGGRILRDHLWFFGGARLAKREVQRFTSQTNIGYSNGFDEKRYEGKLTANITSQHSLYVSYLDITNDETNNAFTPIYDEASIVPARGTPNTLLAVNYNGVLGRNFVLEGQYAKKDFAFEGSGGRFTDRIRGTWIQDSQNPGGRYNAPVFCGVCTAEERNNDAWFAKARYFLDTGSLGGHTVVLGYEDFAETRLANNYQSASQYQITGAFTYLNGTQVNPRFDSNTRITYRPIDILSTGTDFKTRSVFLNDAWALNRHFSFNLGLRYDKNDGKDASGNTVSDDDALSPRLALAYDIRGDGRGRATASFNRYVAKIADGNVGGSAQAAGSPALYTFRYNGPVINPAGTPVDQLLSPQAALAQLFAWFDSVGGTSNSALLTQVAVPGFSTSFDEPITSPFVDEFSLGYGTQIGSNAFAKVDLIARDWDAFYAARIDSSTGQATTPTGSVGDVSFTVNDDGSIKRKYRGIQFQGQWRPGRFLVGGTYTYSTLKGNDQGEGAGTATIRNLPRAMYYPEYLNYRQRIPEGYLAQDVRHRARLWVGYDLPTRFGGFNVTVLQSFDTGTPYGAVGQIDASGISTPFAGSPVKPPYYTLSQLGDSHDYYFTGRDAFRTDDVWSTDAALTYNTPAILGVEVFLRGVVTNLFNQSAVITPNTSIITRRSSASSGLVAFNPVTDTPVEGTHWRKGTQFGQPTGPTSYQIPLTYGFGVGLRF
jgi:outer membrane receptor protein involved in Fe transport